jgi:hypothetical protein
MRSSGDENNYLRGLFNIDPIFCKSKSAVISIIKKKNRKIFENNNYFKRRKKSVNFALLRYRFCFKKNIDLPFMKKVSCMGIKNFYTSKFLIFYDHIFKIFFFISKSFSPLFIFF